MAAGLKTFDAMMTWKVLEAQIEILAEHISEGRQMPETTIHVLRGLNDRCKDGERRLADLEKRLRDLEVRNG